MKNVYEVLRQKEQELVTLQKHVEALRVVAPLLHEEVPAQTAVVSSGNITPVTLPVTNTAPAVNSVPAPTNAPASGWDSTAKRWP
jgi:hypothetical protein